jgi:microcystin-dependent protein
VGKTAVFGFEWPEGEESNDVEGHLKRLCQQFEAKLLSVQAEADSTFLWGVIYPQFFGPLPQRCLPVEGGQYSQSAYPRLAGLLGVTSGTFTLPDMRGYMPRGLTAGGSLGAELGADSVTLSQAQLAPHSHSYTPIPHNHAIPDPGHKHLMDGDGGNRFLVTVEGTSTHRLVIASSGGQQVGFSDIDYAYTGIPGTQVESAGALIGSTGSGAPVPTIPKSRAVRWITRAL